jgi:predicted ATPase/DNA-binding SARP family transcriptional activator/class 3 adenylate cyclase/regulation of enolase protein 1 (concanavalin A-like superfamily)
MSRLALYLLGPPRLELDGLPIVVDRRKAIALLIYLALLPQPHRRDALATLFWPDYGQVSARANLRHTLSVLNQALGEQWLQIDRESVALLPGDDPSTLPPSGVAGQALWLDVTHFHRLLAICAAHGHPTGEVCPACLTPLSQAVALYRDDFLTGFTLPDSPGFDDWQLFQAETLRLELADALERLVRGYAAQGQLKPALAYARRWLALDPLHEPAHRGLMQLHTQAGDRAAALRQYQECARTLKQELGVSPSVETTTLYERIRSGEAMRSGRREAGEEAGKAAYISPAPPLPRSLALEEQEGARERLPAGDGWRLPEEKEPHSPGLSDIEDEIRPVTILCADMSHSIETNWDRQPEETANRVGRLLTAMEQILLKYQARVDRFLSSGALAIFGAPQLHEDDPERAIRAALEIQAAVQEVGLGVSVGINTGAVYFGRMGAEADRAVMALGPVVNLAARLQGQAEAGQILVGAATYRHTQRAFRFSPLSLEIRGMSQPVTVYQVARLRRRPEKSYGIEGLRAELIGRDEELAKLKAALAEMLVGHGRMVSIIGEAGVGKSRLVTELKQANLSDLRFTTIVPEAKRSGIYDDSPRSEAEWDLRLGDRELKSEIQNPKSAKGAQSEILWLEGRCLELGMAASYWPFMDIFRVYFAWQPEDDEVARAERLVSVVQEMVERGDLSAEQGQEIGPLLGNLLSVRFGSEWDERLKNANPEQIRQRTLLAGHDFFVALARRHAVVLVLEDLHWADTLSLDLISLLMEALPQTPLLLLCLYRPERTHKCWHLATIASRKCPTHYTELRLRELTPPQSRRLVESLLTIDNLPDSVRDLILSRSQGNPFFVEEVIRALINAGLIYQEGEFWRARAEIEAVVMPESVQSVILSRVDRLASAPRQVLHAAAIIGRLFRWRVLARMTPPEIDLEHALEVLADYALIYQERAAPEVEYSFKHVLTQEAVYQTIRPQQRAELHRQVAEALEALYQDSLEEYYEPLAYHYNRSEAVENAIEYLLKAGEKARRAYLNDEAIGYFQRALTCLDAQAKAQSEIENQKLVLSEVEGSQIEPWRLAALTGVGQVYFGLGKVAEAEKYFRQAIVLGQGMRLTPRELVRLYFWLEESLWWQGRFDEQLRLGEEGLALLGNDTESVEAALMNQHIANSHLWKGNMERCRELLHRTTHFIQRLPYAEELKPAYYQIISMYAFGDKNVEEALKWLQAFEEQAQQHRDLRALGEVHFQGGDISLHRGDLHRAISQIQQALELFTKIGDIKLNTWCLEMMGWFCLASGDLQKAEEYVSRDLEIAQVVGKTAEIARAYEEIGAIFLSRSTWAKAMGPLQRALQLYRALASPDIVWALVLLGRAYLAQKKRSAALRQFQEAITLIEPNPLGYQWFPEMRPRKPPFTSVLSGLEAAYQDPDAFHAFCQRYREEHPEAGNSPFVQWYLEPTICDFGSFGLAQDKFTISLCAPLADFGFEKDNLNSLKSTLALAQAVENLKWADLFGDCSFRMENGLVIHAANGRDLWHINLSAPRLLRSLEGDFAVQTICVPASDKKPALGGILLWKDQENYLRLDRGVFGEREILFSGCLENKDVVIGRGRLWAPDNKTAEVSLRLERLGRQVKALCSVDGQVWFIVGQVEFPVEDPVEVGLHAIGNIDRTIYQGAYPEGTAIRFESFQVWQRPPVIEKYDIQ